MTCARCYRENATAIRYGGDDYCRTCIDEVFVQCSGCSEHVHRLDIREHEGRQYCSSCHADLFVMCDNCGTTSTAETAHRHNGLDMCEACYDRLVRHAPPPAVVRSYSYKPSPVFHSVGEERKIFMGVELEVDLPHGSRNTNPDAHAALAVLGDEDLIYAKGDGSLRCGIEFVTHPMTVEYYSSLPWDRFFSKLYGFGYRGNEVQNCGLHIHVGRREMGNNPQQRERTIARIVRFYETYYDDIVRFSRRSNGPARQWANAHGIPTAFSDHDTVSSASRHGRYHAVNCTPSNTVEFRIFKGTLDPMTLMASLQFTRELVVAASDMSDDEFNALTYKKHIDNVSARYPEMRNYMCADRSALP